jgi:hypothetical protein
MSEQIVLLVVVICSQSFGGPFGVIPVMAPKERMAIDKLDDFLKRNIDFLLRVYWRGMESASIVP